MAAGKYTFIIEQGATTEFEVVWKDSAGDPVSLTDYHARMHIRSHYGSGGELYASLSSSRDKDGTGFDMNGIDGSKHRHSGSMGLYISAASSSAFTFNEAKYDLEMVSGSRVTRLLQGNIKLSKEVTV